MKRRRSPETTGKRHSCLWWTAHIVVWGVVIAALTAVAAGLAGYLVYHHVTREGTPGPAVRIEVPEGATGYGVGQILAEEGLLEHELLFRLAIRLDQGEGHIKHGQYDLPRGLGPMQLLELLREGPNVAPPAEAVPDECKVTIPEGLTIAQMAARFDEPEAFITAASDPALIAQVGVEAKTLEGFLMPNTYFFDEKPSEREVVERMLEEHLTQWDLLLGEYPQAAARDKMEVVTVASLVEEEARADGERPLIAAVIYNRLEKGMPLELDATLQYALAKYGQRMLYRDKEVDSPYNTYKNRGLPPGPISNPGTAALRAAIDPANKDYLFFVSNADGETHTFSSTMHEHTRAVARYRREIAAQRRKLKEEQRQQASDGQ